MAMIPSLLAQIGVPMLTSILKNVFAKTDDPLTTGAANILDDLDQAFKRGEITHEKISEANRHAEKIAEIEIKAQGQNLAEINKSLRSEIISDDPYIRRMRPTFGYVMAFTWAAQMCAVAYVLVFETDKSGAVLNAMASLSTMWAVGLSVLGVYVYKRSEDKKL